jgi:adenylosuccinate synthase
MNDIDCFKAKTDVFKIRKPKPMDYDHIVFEGAQGIMLDMDYGFFPNVTRSNTTSKNALEMINEMAIPFVEMYYMTRAYQTRHGNGAMTGEKYSDLLKLKNIEGETNVMNEYQGSFRKAPLDLNLLEYALNCDKIHSGSVSKKNIVITCLDQVNEDEIVVNEGNDNVTLHSLETLVSQEVFSNYKVFVNYDPAGNTFCDARSVGVLN